MGEKLGYSEEIIAAAGQCALAAVATYEAAATANAARALVAQAPATRLSVKATGKRKRETPAQRKRETPAPTPIVLAARGPAEKRPKAASDLPEARLTGGQRGSMVVVMGKANYQAGKGYDFSDVIAGPEAELGRAQQIDRRSVVR